MKKTAILHLAALVLAFGTACGVTQQPGDEDEPEEGGKAETTQKAQDEAQKQQEGVQQQAQPEVEVEK